mgnify:CR=1 FL=1|tara:strand:- start:245 stop:436 length:192 start_codon:yes stop_codon:yes gene_type:complete
MFKNMPKLGVLLIIILLAFFIVEALNIKEGFNVSDVNEDEEYTDNVTSESFSSINNSSIGAPY